MVQGLEFRVQGLEFRVQGLQSVRYRLCFLNVVGPNGRVGIPLILGTAAL